MKTAQRKLNILTVEDNPGDLYMVQGMLKESRLKINNLYSTDRIEEACKVLQNHSIHLVLLDLSLADSFGIDSFLVIKTATQKIPVIILTGLSDASIAIEAIKQGAQDYLVKGEFNGDLLSKAIEYSFERTSNLEILKESNERFNLVAKATNDVIWDWNLETDEVFLVGDAHKKLFGYNIENTITPQYLWENSLHPDDEKRVISRLKKFVHDADSSIWEDEYRLIKADNTYAYVHDRGYLIYGIDGKPTRMIGSMQDITQRKQFEKLILASEAKYRQMFYKNPYPAWVFEPNTLQIVEVNDAAIKRYDYSKDEFLNLTMEDIRIVEVDPAQLTVLKDHYKNFESGAELWRHKKKNGDEVIVEVTVFPIDYFGQTAMQALINDVTEKIQLQEELEQQQKIKSLQITEAVLSAQEKERAIIGEELHDNINQILATVKLYLDVAISEKSRRDELVKKSRENVIMTIEEIRKISKMLIAPSLNDLGLIESIEELIRAILIAKKIKITFNSEELDESLIDKDQKTTIYRILQEQLNNVLKHAFASSVFIEVKTENEQTILTVTDNGKGFDPSAYRKGVGITNITSRAELYAGKVEIDSAPGKGCKLKVVLNARQLTSSKY